MIVRLLTRPRVRCASLVFDVQRRRRKDVDKDRHSTRQRSKVPRVRCATLGIDVQCLRRIESAGAKEPTAARGKLFEITTVRALTPALG